MPDAHGSADYVIGLDIGSISVNLAVFDLNSRKVVKTVYRRFHGQPVKEATAVLSDAIEEFKPGKIKAIATTGAGGRLINNCLEGFFVNEIIAQAKGAEFLYPHVNTVIEMGGQDSKFILIEKDLSGKSRIKDFATNTICAAGTGSFLDQQANRLNISIEDEFACLAMKSSCPPRIAGRCSVFAKSDMIHLQQIGTPDYDIVAGLCCAVARNFKSTIARGKEFVKPIAFQGGVASNGGMIKAFTDVLGLNEGELIVHEHHAITGAIGAVLALIEEGRDKFPFTGLEKLKAFSRDKNVIPVGILPRLDMEKSVYLHDPSKSYDFSGYGKGEKVKVYLGIDIGSISTNVVAIDENFNVVARRYLMTAGRPIEAVRQGLSEIGSEVGDKVEVIGAGTTGSGRYLIGDFVGADVVRNEITAQARAAAAIDPEVDTIFEIGGQDSKYISLSGGVVSDFEMNKVCAAGTGSFIEEQAEKLQVDIKKEFSRIALHAKNPVQMGERCTVFIESDIVNHQQRGTKTEDIVAGLCYSIVYNYLNRVVGNRKIGNKIFFQGGVAYNKGVISAFEKVVDKKIIVPPHHDVTGAIGVAMLAAESNIEKTLFKGFDLSKRRYETKTFECSDCSNLCEIRRVTIDGEKPLFYGSRCEKFDIERKIVKSDMPDFFEERENHLLNSYKGSGKKGNGKKVGIPRILYAFELYPMWQSFFEELGFEVVLSSQTNKKIIQNGLENVAAETCFPIKVAHGHVIDLLEKEVDYLFLPSIISMYRDKATNCENHTCPYVQASPYIINASLGIDAAGKKVLQPIFRFQAGEKSIRSTFIDIGKSVGADSGSALRAYRVAADIQSRFYYMIKKRGAEFLKSLLPDEKALVLVSRSYNGLDSGVNLGLPKKLRALGVKTIPMDFLPLDDVDISDYHPNMYWKSGQRILAAAKYIKSHPNLFAVYLTNFGCGPDSFINHFFADIMKGKPYLQLEIDEHSADAGAITRCEAFLDSLNNYRTVSLPVENLKTTIIRNLKSRNRTIFIPNMTDHAYAIKAAFNSNSVDAEVVEESDGQTLQLGRKYTSGKECYPCILTTGDLFKAIRQSGLTPEKIAFFMPSAEGPCRFGQYHQFQRLVLDENGYEDIPIYSLEPQHSYGDNMFGNGFDLLAWKGVVAIDVLEKAARQVRPYEVNKGETDAVYDYCLKYVCNVMKCKGDILTALNHCREKFEAIKVNGRGSKPKIGIVGEIYIRSNRFANQGLVKKIEALGSEAWVAPLSEWFLYANYVYKVRNTERGKKIEYVKRIIKDRVQKTHEHKIYKTFEGFLKNGCEPDTDVLIDSSRKYIDPSFDGEAVLSVGKAIDYINKGLNGIINAIPFTCLPGTVVTAISKRLSKDSGNIPWLNIAYDGIDESGSENRLEAFVHQAKEFRGKS